MITTKIKLINKLGLHARASAKFVATAAKFVSHVDVSANEKTVNGKSIMGVMGLTAKCDTVLTLEINGVDEEQMNQYLTTLINERFGEEQ